MESESGPHRQLVTRGEVRSHLEVAVPRWRLPDWAVRGRPVRATQAVRGPVGEERAEIHAFLAAVLGGVI